MSVKKPKRRAKRKPAPRIYIRPDPAELETLRRDLALTRQELAAYKSRFLQTAAQAPAWQKERAELVRQLDEARAAYDALLAGVVEAPPMVAPPTAGDDALLRAACTATVAANTAPMGDPPKLSPLPDDQRAAIDAMCAEFRAEVERLVADLRDVEQRLDGAGH